MLRTFVLRIRSAMDAPPLSFAAPLESEHVVRFRDPVRRFVGARVRNDALADDLTQEIFIRVLRRLPEVKDPRRVMGWMFQIAHRLECAGSSHSVV